MPHRKISPPTNAESPRIVNWRLLFKVVIKRGIVLGRNLQSLGQGVYTEANKVVTEARAELDRERTKKDASAGLGGSN